MSTSRSSRLSRLIPSRFRSSRAAPSAPPEALTSSDPRASDTTASAASYATSSTYNDTTTRNATSITASELFSPGIEIHSQGPEPRIDTMTVRYNYTKLPDNSRYIRLLELHPRTLVSDPVRCALHVVCIADNEPYRALSYAWQDKEPEDPVHISCDGQEIPIHANLHRALRQLRHKSQSAFLWIDFLCINQSDIDERNQQVSLMGKIYRQSTDVVIWLGEPAKAAFSWSSLDGIDSGEVSMEQWYGDKRDQEYVDRYVHWLSRADELLELPPLDFEDILGALCLLSLLSRGTRIEHIPFYLSPARHVAPMSDLSTSARIRKGLWAMMDSSWWSRTWVVQENVLASRATVHLGSFKVPWVMLVRAASNISRDGLFDYFMDTSIGFAVNSRQDPLIHCARTVLKMETTRVDVLSDQPVSLYSLLRKFRDRAASDSRDKVYALVGLASDWGASATGPISPDYRLNASTLFTLTSAHLISRMNSLSVLVGTLRSDPDGWAREPSWATDWGAMPALHENERLDRFHLYSADLGGTCRAYLHQSKVLVTQSFFVDRVQSTAQAAPESGYQRFRVAIDEWDRTGWARTGRYSDQNTFWRAVCGDMAYTPATSGDSHTTTTTTLTTWRRAKSSDWDTYAERWSNAKLMKQLHRSTAFCGRLVMRNPDLVSTSNPENSLQHALECNSGSRVYFKTQSGYVGIGPPDMKPDDHIYVLMGSPVPFILRPVVPAVCAGSRPIVLTQYQGGPSPWEDTCSSVHFPSYCLVGDAYVQGIMDGEIVKGATQQASWVHLH